MAARGESSQLELDLKPKTWGGKRAGAGRKKSTSSSDPEHRSRPIHKRRYPVHVVLRTRPEVGRLRRGPILAAVRRALLAISNRVMYRVVHMSIQYNHLHLLVEAEDTRSLSRGMQALAISVARSTNASLGRSGKVFEHRYHATPIKTPRQARHALAYVLNNWRRHQEDFTTPGADRAHLDPYATGIAFPGWLRFGRFAAPAGYDPLPVSRPQTWLLITGWLKHGEIDVREVPGSFRIRSADQNRTRPLRPTTPPTLAGNSSR